MSGSSSLPIGHAQQGVAPTPQNTPLNNAPLAGLASQLSRPTVSAITEEDGSDGESADSADGPPDTPPNGKSGGDALRLGADGQAAMLGLVQERLAGLMGKSSGYIESLPLGTKRKVEGLKGVQKQWESLHLQFKLECIELEKKYLKLATPLYDRRLAVINGTSQPTAQELTAGAEESAKDDPDAEALPALPADPSTEPGATEGIQHFWLTALQNHQGISELISDRDEAALKHLVDVRYEHLEKPDLGFKLIFIFSENEFFQNKVLEKTYFYQSELGYGGDFVFDHATGTEIKWKEDKDLTKEIQIKKQRNKNTNRTRLVRKAIPVDSFFNFFYPPTPPSDEDIDAGKYEEEELEELDNKLELDYQIGEDFKEKIIPRAIDYFTGKALQYELDEDDEYEEDSDDDEDSEDDDDDDDDIPKKKAAPKGAKKGGQDPGECKQQ